MRSCLLSKDCESVALVSQEIVALEQLSSDCSARTSFVRLQLSLGRLTDSDFRACLVKVQLSEHLLTGSQLPNSPRQTAADRHPSTNRSSRMALYDHGTVNLV